MRGTAQSLVELVHALELGITFYDGAMQYVTDPSVADIFFRVRQTKKNLAAALASEITSPSDATYKDGTWILALRQGYAGIGSDLARNADVADALGLDVQEDRLLDAFRLIAASDPSEHVRAVVQQHLPTVQRMHAEISSLARS